jgi:hypothetical protein
LGFIDAIRYPKSAFSIFVGLYLAGIFLTLPLIGADGGERVKISNDIFVYFVAARGFQLLLDRDSMLPAGPASASATEKIWIYSIPAVTIIILIVLPYALKMNAAKPIPTKPKLTQISAEMLAQNLKSMPNLISMEKLRYLHSRWPKPSFENVNNHLAYVRIRYTTRDSLHFETNNGIKARGREFWPMDERIASFNRTIHTRSWTIFPNMTIRDLARFDQRDIVVVGKLITRSRGWKYDTGYALVASHIFFLDNNAKIKSVQL